MFWFAMLFKSCRETSICFTNYILEQRPVQVNLYTRLLLEKTRNFVFSRGEMKIPLPSPCNSYISFHFPCPHIKSINAYFINQPIWWWFCNRIKLLFSISWFQDVFILRFLFYSLLSKTVDWFWVFLNELKCMHPGN